VAALLRIFADILLPVFLVVGIGIVAGRRLDLDARTLSRVAYWILGPVFVFDILARADLAAGLVGRLVLATLLAVAGAGLVGWLIARASGREPQVVAATLSTSVYGNVGNFGLAIVAFTFGADALPLAGIVLVSVNLTGIVVGVAAARWNEHGAAAALRRAVTAPLTLAVLPALVVNAGNVTLPLWLARPVDLVAAALIPMMLLTLGIQLAGMRRRRPDLRVAPALLAKLLVAPLLAAATAGVVGLTGIPFGVVVLQLAMPPAVFTALIALEHDLVPDLVTTTVLTGTLASVVTLPVVIRLLTAG